MGRIVRARDLRLGRTVAIKELLAGHDDARFEREARIVWLAAATNHHAR